MKITEYKTASASDCEKLDAAVKDLLAEGFEPFGSPYVAKTEHKGISQFCQAMVKSRR